MTSVYPKDEFDDIPDGGPIGVHRKPVSPWRPVLPFLVVLVVVPLLAWGVATLIQRNVPDETVDKIIEVTAQSEPQSDEVEEVEVEEDLPDSDIPTAADDGDETEASAEEPAEAAEATVNHGASVGVYNASGIGGYAAGIVADLQANGFANAFPDNANNWGVDQNTVFYSQDADKATAEAVAQALGFPVVQDGSHMGDLNVLVLLVN